MSNTSTVLSSIFILIGRSRSCILAGSDTVAVDRFCPGSKVLTPMVFWTPKREPGVCKTLYVPSISPIFQQRAESKDMWKKIEDYSLKDSFPPICWGKHYPLKHSNTQSPYLTLFILLSKPIIKVMKHWSKVQLLGRKTSGKKTPRLFQNTVKKQDTQICALHPPHTLTFLFLVIFSCWFSFLNQVTTARVLLIAQEKPPRAGRGG